VLTETCFVSDICMLCDDLIDVNITLYRLNLCTNGPNFDLPTFFTFHSVDANNVRLTRKDAKRCASH
jgi:hypothetical protein